MKDNIQVWRIMLYGTGGIKPDKDSDLRDVTPDELAANLASVVFTPGAEDRRLGLRGQSIDELGYAGAPLLVYAFGGGTNAALVHYVTPVRAMRTTARSCCRPTATSTPTATPAPDRCPA